MDSRSMQGSRPVSVQMQHSDCFIIEQFLRMNSGALLSTALLGGPGVLGSQAGVHGGKVLACMEVSETSYFHHCKMEGEKMYLNITKKFLILAYTLVIQATIFVSSLLVQRSVDCQTPLCEEMLSPNIVFLPC